MTSALKRAYSTIQVETRPLQRLQLVDTQEVRVTLVFVAGPRLFQEEVVDILVEQQHLPRPRPQPRHPLLAEDTLVEAARAVDTLVVS